jgi:nitrile hydratase
MKFSPGARVRVKNDWPETRGPCHIRTPWYLRGERGTVVRHLGDFANPEDLAFARPAAKLPLYHVRFDQPSLWHEAHAGDEVVVEIFSTWLEAI